MNGLQKVSLLRQVHVVFSLCLKSRIDFAKVKNDGFTYVFLRLSTVQVGDDIRRIVSQELSWSLKILSFRLTVVAL